MAGAPEPGGTTWSPVRRGRSRVAMAAGVLALLVAVLAGLALVDSFLMEAQPGSGPGSGGDSGGSGGSGTGGDGSGPSGGGIDCDRLLRILAIVFWSLVGISVALLVLAVGLRGRFGGRALTNPVAVAAWCALALAVVAGLAWLQVHASCHPPEPRERGEPDLPSCQEVAGWLFGAGAAAVVGTIALGLLARRRPPGQRMESGPGTAAVVAGFVAVSLLLGAAAVLSLCDPPSGETQQRDLPECHHIALGLAIAGGVLAVAGAGLLAWNRARRGRWLAGSGKAGMGLLVLGGLLLLAAVVLLWLCQSGGAASAGGGGDGGGDGGEGDPDVPEREVPEWNLLLWILGALLAVGLVVAAVRAWSRRGRGEAAEAGDAEEAEVPPAERQRLLAHLEAAPTSREAVIAAYRAFLAACTRRGMARRAWETPTEHARRAARRMRLPADEVAELVQSYQSARLGDQEPSDAQRRRAAELARSLDGGEGQP